MSRIQPEASAPVSDAGLSTVTAIILAGGIGSRLKDITDLPKPIVPVFGKPFLYYLLKLLKKGGVKQAIICAGYRSNLVIETMRQWNAGVDLAFSIEATAMGTGGAFRLASQQLMTATALLMNGDSLCDFHLPAFLAFHQQHPDQVSILTIEVDDCGRYGKVHFAADGRIERFEEKNPQAGNGWINAGVYLVPAKKLCELPHTTPLSLERDVFPQWLREGAFAFPIQASFLDIGTPESYQQKEAFIERLALALSPSL